MCNVFASWPVKPEEAALISEYWPPECRVLTRTALSPGQLLDQADKIDVIVAGEVQPELLRRATNLKFIHVLGHGIDRLAEGEVGELMRARQIPIVRANPAATAIAEYVMMSLILLNRRILAQHDALAHRGDWSRKLIQNRFEGSVGGELDGSTLCVAGLGSIGLAIVKRARAFGMRVGALTRDPARHVSAELDFVGDIAAPDHWLAQSRHVVLALPLTAATTGFISTARLALLPKGSFVVNVGRAQLMDEDALSKALASGQLGGAAIDVWEDEEAQTYPSRHPLQHFNVLMTPHSSAITLESRTRAIATVGKNLRRHLRHEGLATEFVA